MVGGNFILLRVTLFTSCTLTIFFKAGCDMDVGGQGLPAFAPSSRAGDVLQQAVNSGNCFVGLPRLPWDASTAVGQILGTGSVAPWFKGPVVPRNFPVVCNGSATPLDRSTSELKHAAGTKIHICLDDHRDIQRARVLKMICDLVLMFEHSSILGQQLLEAERSLSSREKIMQILCDAMARKSTSTLETRAGSTALYVSWFRKSPNASDALVRNESLVYDCFYHIRETLPSATRANTFMSTVAFLRHCVGFVGLDDVLNSSRCLGSAHTLLLLKRPTKLSQPFSPWIVAIFEVAAMYGADLRMKAEAGLILIGTRGRFRASDMSCIKAGTLSEKFFECELLSTKTSRRSAVRARTFLPGSVLRRGLLGLDWVAEFLKARVALGSTDFVLLPSERSAVKSVYQWSLQRSRPPSGAFSAT